MKQATSFLLMLISCGFALAQSPEVDTTVTIRNYRQHPHSEWSFRNIGAPLHILMIPRSGPVISLKEKPDDSIPAFKVTDTENILTDFRDVFKDNYADGIIVLKKGAIVYEEYWNGLNRDHQHIWFSISKSLASAAFGLLVEEYKLDLLKSPAAYIPELKGSAYERATLQDVLNMSTALGFEENYTDTSSFFAKYYGAAINMEYIQGSQADARNTGIQYFLTEKAFANQRLVPGEKFEYNSTNADIISWMITRLSGQPYHEYIQKRIWAKLGAEHDAYMVCDRTNTAVATSGMNSTLRDAARFGMLVLNRGVVSGQNVIPAAWLRQSIKLDSNDKKRYAKNEPYTKAGMPWVAYKNFWWILDPNQEEFAAVGIHGQVIYINRKADLVISYFSSQPNASSIASYKPFVSKLNACRQLAQKLMTK